MCQPGVNTGAQRTSDQGQFLFKHTSAQRKQCRLASINSNDKFFHPLLKRRSCLDLQDKQQMQNASLSLSILVRQQDSYRRIPTYIKGHQNNIYSVTFLSHYVNACWTWCSITSFNCAYKSSKAGVNKCNHIFGRRAASS